MVLTDMSNSFVDRDMLMRYLGDAPGHIEWLQGRVKLEDVAKEILSKKKLLELVVLRNAQTGSQDAWEDTMEALDEQEDEEEEDEDHEFSVAADGEDVDMENARYSDSGTDSDYDTDDDDWGADSEMGSDDETGSEEQEDATSREEDCN